MTPGVRLAVGTALVLAAGCQRRPSEAGASTSRPAAAPAAGNAGAEEAATAAAQAWLALVDAAKYDESWAEAATLFRKAVDRDNWKKQLDAIRTPMGQELSRKVRAAHFETRLPGAPDGAYVVIQYDSSFGNKAQAVETVTPMKDADGRWRVSGYYIR
jgi:uncharacterized protein DUF4019